MKNIIKIISFITVVLCFTLIVSASTPLNSIEYPDAGVTVQFEADSSLTPEQRQMIADSIVLHTPIVQSRSWCWLTGHKTKMETVTATYHKEHKYTPRCRLDIYIITTCEKCDYYAEELDSTGYITCCPED